MRLYTVALFVHVTGVVGMFSGLGVWVFGVAALRRAQRVEQVRLITVAIRAAGNLMVGSIVVLGIAGLYMAGTTWGIRASWIVVATISFALLAPVGVLLLDPRVRAIARQAQGAAEGPLAKELERRARDPLLGTGLRVYVSCLVGIVFLMTNKPPLVASVVAMSIALAIGLASSAPLWRTAIT